MNAHKQQVQMQLTKIEDLTTLADSGDYEAVSAAYSFGGLIAVAGATATLVEYGMGANKWARRATIALTASGVGCAIFCRKSTDNAVARAISISGEPSDQLPGYIIPIADT